MPTEPAPCPYCGKPVEGDRETCASCGKTLPPLPHLLQTVKIQKTKEDFVSSLLMKSLGAVTLLTGVELLFKHVFVVQYTATVKDVLETLRLLILAPTLYSVIQLLRLVQDMRRKRKQSDLPKVP